MSDKIKTTEPPCLEGDTLRLSPAQFASLQWIINNEMSFHGPDEAARIAMRAIGLTDEQIETRRYRETKVVVSYGR